MSSWNLSDNVNESFEFEVSGKKFAMKYPLTSELDSIQEKYSKLADIRSQLDKAIKEDNQQSLDLAKAEEKGISEDLETALYQFITPVNHQEDIKTVMETQNVRVLRNFNKMIAAELAIS